MICSVCGSEIADSSTKCPVCGLDPRVSSYSETDDTNNRASYRDDNAASFTPSDDKMKTFQEGARRFADHAAFLAKSTAEQANTSFTSMTNEIDNEEYGFPKSENAKVRRVGSFYLAENEIVIRQYLCAYLSSGFFKKRENKGYLFVTNQRVMFEGKDKNSRISMEAPISSISGINTFIGKHRNWLLTTIGAMIILISMSMYFSSCLFSYHFSTGRYSTNVGSYFMELFFMALGAFLILMASRRVYMLTLHSNAVVGTAIQIGEGLKSTLFNNQSLYTLAAVPTEETKQMLDEIGALIYDIQTLGDAAIQKWR